MSKASGRKGAAKASVHPEIDQVLARAKDKREKIATAFGVAGGVRVHVLTLPGEPLYLGAELPDFFGKTSKFVVYREDVLAVVSLKSQMEHVYRHHLYQIRTKTMSDEVKRSLTLVNDFYGQLMQMATELSRVLDGDSAGKDCGSENEGELECPETKQMLVGPLLMKTTHPELARLDAILEHADYLRERSEFLTPFSRAYCSNLDVEWLIPGPQAFLPEEYQLTDEDLTAPTLEAVEV